ncbi:hypothetical protein N7510_009823 [Penicillium lagena]|uniref:uncharacterized protein n=1 Tax=Penicillium lagena TaxID=94218 RepID=UPI00253FABF2|nr:uncharacterized protein N7510_009823 [Penicillium lagena]KAJ5604669.1 hypothetical protein N7510_009823 [Penicillium lagena]
MDGGPREKSEAARLKHDIRRFFGQRKKEVSSSTPPVSQGAVEVAMDKPFSLHDRNLGTTFEGCKSRMLSDISLHIGDEVEAPNDPIGRNVTASEPSEANTLIAHDSATRSSLSMIRSYRETELLMHYLDYVFPLQFRFYDFSSHPGGRGWLLWLLFNTGPLLHATLSLSALHQYTLFHPQSDRRAKELAAYHENALRDLQVFLENAGMDNDTNGNIRDVTVLACGISLISFEGGICNWQLHLNALLSILDRCDLSSFGKSCVIENELDESFDWQHTALSFFLTVLLWFDLLSCVSTETTPRLPYRRLLDDGIVNMESVMGCTNRVMRAIGDLANLSSWKCRAKELQVLNTRELLLRSLEIEKQLEEGLSELGTTAEQSPGDPMKGPNRFSESVQFVTRAFATSALVQLQTIASDSYPDLFQLQSAVSRNIAILKHIDDPQTVRGLVWPLCVSGSMAEPDQQSIYRNFVRRAMKSSREFGNLDALLLIMEKCWEMRRLEAERDVNWKTAMNELNISLLLI